MRILHFFMFAVLIMIFRFIMLISVLLQAKISKNRKIRKFNRHAVEWGIAVTHWNRRLKCFLFFYYQNFKEKNNEEDK